MFPHHGISDGMTNGTDGMRYSLVSRDIIADSIEAVCAGQYYDSVITVPGCDKKICLVLLLQWRVLIDLLLWFMVEV